MRKLNSIRFLSLRPSLFETDKQYLVRDDPLRKGTRRWMRAYKYNEDIIIQLLEKIKESGTDSKIVQVFIKDGTINAFPAEREVDVVMVNRFKGAYEKIKNKFGFSSTVKKSQFMASIKSDLLIMQSDQENRKDVTGE